MEQKKIGLRSFVSRIAAMDFLLASVLKHNSSSSFGNTRTASEKNNFKRPQGQKVKKELSLGAVEHEHLIIFHNFKKLLLRKTIEADWI